MNIRENTEQTKLFQKKRSKYNEYLKNYRANNASLQKRAKRNEYQKSYILNSASPQKRAKRKENQKITE